MTENNAKPKRLAKTPLPKVTSKTIGLVYNLRELRLAEPNRPLSPLEEVLENWLRQECRRATKSSTVEGFVAAGGIATGVWAGSVQDDSFHHRLSTVERQFVPLAVATIRERHDQADPETSPLISDERGTLWLRLFYDLELAQASAKLYSYQSYLTQLLSTSVPECPPDHLSPQQADHLKQLFGDLPEDFDRRVAALAAVHAAVRQELADQLAPVLNAKAQATPHDTYEEKKALARWVNEELRKFDLAIKCPKTGEPSILLGDPGNHPEVGRFCIEHKTPDGKRHRSVSTPDLPEFELMEAPPRREAIKEWRERVGQQRGGTSRA